MKIVEHNGIRLTFDQKNHSFVDSNGVKYTSVTRLIDRAFPIFEKEAAAKKKSAKTGIPFQNYVDEWEKIGKEAANEGSLMHEIAEKVIRKQEKFIPRNRNEKLDLQEIQNTVSILERRYSLEPEVIIFSPKYHVAGIVDLLGSGKDVFCVFDWKRIHRLERSSGKFGTIMPTMKLMNCNFVHYSLQTALYEIILKEERYIPSDSQVNRFLLVRNAFGGAFNPICCGDFLYEAQELLKWHRHFSCDYL